MQTGFELAKSGDCLHCPKALTTFATPRQSFYGAWTERAVPPFRPIRTITSETACFALQGRRVDYSAKSGDCPSVPRRPATLAETAAILPRRVDRAGCPHFSPRPHSRQCVSYPLFSGEQAPRILMVRVSLFVTCVVDQVFPSVGMAMAEVLERAGCDLEFRESQTCCAQPAFNSGYRDEARSVAEHFLKTFEGAEYIVVPSGSCCSMISHHFADLLPGDKRVHDLEPKVWKISANSS